MQVSSRLLFRFLIVVLSLMLVLGVYLSLNSLNQASATSGGASVSVYTPCTGTDYAKVQCYIDKYIQDQYSANGEGEGSVAASQSTPDGFYVNQKTLKSMVDSNNDGTILGEGDDLAKAPVLIDNLNQLTTVIPGTNFRCNWNEDSCFTSGSVADVKTLVDDHEAATGQVPSLIDYCLTDHTAAPTTGAWGYIAQAGGLATDGSVPKVYGFAWGRDGWTNTMVTGYTNSNTVTSPGGTSTYTPPSTVPGSCTSGGGDADLVRCTAEWAIGKYTGEGNVGNGQFLPLSAGQIIDIRTDTPASTVNSGGTLPAVQVPINTIFNTGLINVNPSVTNGVLIASASQGPGGIVAEGLRMLGYVTASNGYIHSGVPYYNNTLSVGQEQPNTGVAYTLDTVAGQCNATGTPDCAGVFGAQDVGAEMNTTAPTISAVSSNPAATSADITWTTDQPSTSVVKYGTTSGGENTTVTTGCDHGGTGENCTILRGSHSLTLTGLSPGVTYYYKVTSYNNQALPSADTTEYQVTTLNQPTVTPDQASPWYTNSTSPTLSATLSGAPSGYNYDKSGDGIDVNGTACTLIGGTLNISGAGPGSGAMSCTGETLPEGQNAVSYSAVYTNGTASNPGTATQTVDVDLINPVISNLLPSGTITTSNPTISADLNDPPSDTSPPVASGIDTNSVVVKLDGNTVNTCTVTASHVSCPVSVTKGTHNYTVDAKDNAGNSATQQQGSFTLNQINYYWPWYDNVEGNDWVILGNNNVPYSASATFDMSIGSSHMDLGGASSVDPQQVKWAMFPNEMDGPAKLTSTNGVSGILSQRILWPKGGNSLEEVPATQEPGSDHFWWTWYDMTGGFSDWVMVTNPSATDTVHVVVSFTNQADGAPQSQEGDIAPNGTLSLTFPGKMGGPVELKAYKQGGSWPTNKENVIASQRVLSGGGSAFNELSGIADSSLGDEYQWPWYDMTAGAKDWVMISNPNASSVYYRITIAGQVKVNNATIPAVGTVSPTFPGTMNGAVQVNACTVAFDAGGGCSGVAKVIASQRSMWGPSFEEVPGGYHASADAWAWYDQNEGPGVTDWVMIANADQSTTATGVTVKINNKVVYGPVDLPPNTVISPTFSGVQNGPVQVTTTAGSVVTSQRVLWNGYFNEVMGQPPVA